MSGGTVYTSQGESQPHFVMSGNSIQVLYHGLGVNFSQSQPRFVMGINYNKDHRHDMYISPSQPRPQVLMGGTSGPPLTYGTYDGNNTPQSMPSVYPTHRSFQGLLRGSSVENFAVHLSQAPHSPADSHTFDLNTTTTGSVQCTLGSEFGVNLSDHKAFIRDQIDSFLETCVQRTHNNAVTVEEEEDEEAIHEEASETLKLEDNKSKSEEEEESDGQRSKKRREITLGTCCKFLNCKRTFLSGMMGSRKTAVGKVLSEALAYSFVDRCGEGGFERKMGTSV
ncbi:hypothetical protein LOK49_LG10G01535 [Camellia lanceoleosa]|uniref:Uncharacterized protein n=1 Tax=Camellia lanceoleosa TaxID=1840588 RepID=A0ACC0G7H6_9ERIC|nr:hypothetical protein LOK49_LG10G01535 [Camellia lanceoleosa]